ncbi:MAG TPA: carboxypeptidase-like regulatory domain-containing protein, partial [Planctomycetaceae bacterium]|nr:carboxypeptidase-like regulatory domain-containing protein [Planctomycetaceae bacterium]
MAALFARCVFVPSRAFLFLAVPAFCSLLPAPARAQTKEPAASTSPPAKALVAAKKSTLTLHCFVGRGRTPLDGVDIEFRARLARDSKQQWVRSDAHGVAVLEWPADKKVQGLWFTARKAKFVPMEYWWDNQNGEPTIPPQMDLQFERGHQIGGVVRDESGRPVVGVRLRFNMPVAGVDHPNGAFTAGDAFTNDQGRWSWSEAPADCSGVNIEIRHFDYLSEWTPASRSREMVFVLKRGLAVSGRVIGPTGKPVAGARVMLGYQRWNPDENKTSTTSDGRFTLRNCKPGRAFVTVQAPGFAPGMQDVEVAKQTKPVELRLEPGHTVKIRVVDAHGKPMAHANVWASSWRGNSTLNFDSETDAKGELVWDSAPADSILVYGHKEGYMSSGQVRVRPSNDFQVITLAPELFISGRVTDASTGRPIESFHIRHGLVFQNASSQIFWQRPGPAYENGRYRFKMRQQQFGVALQVIAKGYKPARSRTFHTSEGSQTCDFSLQPGKGPSGVVVRPDGTPISGVDVALASEDGRVSVTQGRFDRNQNAAEMTKTDARGHFEFLPRNDEPYAVIALSDLGFAEASTAQVEKRLPLTLRPWGRLKGHVLLGHAPDAGRKVSYTPQSASRGPFAFYVWNFRYETQTDQEGRFEFDRVMPNAGTVSRITLVEFGRGRQEAPGWTVPVDIHEGRTTEVTIGGSGRLVVGKARVKGTPERPVSWATNEPVMITAWDKTRNTQAQPTQQYVGTFLASGEFRAPDVPAGNYKLTLQIDSPSVANAWAGGQVIGEGTREFT